MSQLRESDSISARRLATLRWTVVLAVGCSLVACGGGQPIDLTGLDAQKVLDQSIAFHDPEGMFHQQGFAIELAESRPDGDDRQTRILIDLPQSLFKIETTREGHDVAGEVKEDFATVLIDGEEVVDPIRAEDLRVDPRNLRRLRDYYTYLYGLPMKLRDPGTILGDIEASEFDGKPAIQMRVTYEVDVGSDIWYFYFAPDTYALTGYRFYHDEAAGDGEYIHLDGLTAVGSMQLPKERTWYRHTDDGELGTDTIVGVL